MAVAAGRFHGKNAAHIFLALVMRKPHLRTGGTATLEAVGEELYISCFLEMPLDTFGNFQRLVVAPLPETLKVERDRDNGVKVESGEEGMQGQKPTQGIAKGEYPRKLVTKNHFAEVPFIRPVENGAIPRGTLGQAGKA